MSQSNRMVKRNILLVASDKPVIARFSALLNTENYLVMCCPDIKMSQNQLKSQAVSLVLINVDASKPNVIDIASALRLIRPNLKVVALTGFAHRALIKEAMAKGAIDAVALKTSDDHDFLTLLDNLFVAENTEPKGRAGVIRSNKALNGQQTPPENSLLHDLVAKHPGILTGSWSESDSFSLKPIAAKLT